MWPIICIYWRVEAYVWLNAVIVAIVLKMWERRKYTYFILSMHRKLVLTDVFDHSVFAFHRIHHSSFITHYSTTLMTHTTNPFIHPSFHPPTRSSIHQYIYQFTYPPINLSINPSISSLIHTSIHPSIYPIHHSNQLLRIHWPTN